MAQQQLQHPDYQEELRRNQQEQQDMAKSNKKQRRNTSRPSPVSCGPPHIRIAQGGKKQTPPRCPETVRLRRAVEAGTPDHFKGFTICPVSGRVIPPGQAFHIPTKSPSNVSSVLPPAQYISAFQKRSLQTNCASPAACVAAVQLNPELTETQKSVLTEYVIQFYNCHRQTVEKAVVSGLAAYYAGDTAALQLAFAPSAIDTLNRDGYVTFANREGRKKKSTQATTSASEDESEIPQLDPNDIKLNETLTIPEGVTVADIASVFAQADEVLLASQ